MANKSYANCKKYIEEHPEAEDAYITKCPDCGSYQLIYPVEDKELPLKTIHFKSTLLDILKWKLTKMKPTYGKIYDY